MAPCHGYHVQVHTRNCNVRCRSATWSGLVRCSQIYESACETRVCFLPSRDFPVARWLLLASRLRKPAFPAAGRGGVYDWVDVCVCASGVSLYFHFTTSTVTHYTTVWELFFCNFWFIDVFVLLWTSGAFFSGDEHFVPKRFAAYMYWLLFFPPISIDHQ